MGLKLFQILLLGFLLIISGGCHLFFDTDKGDFLDPPLVQMENWGKEIRITFEENEEWRENIRKIRLYLIFEVEQEDEEIAGLQFLPEYEVGKEEITLKKPELEDAKETDPKFMPPFYWREEDVPLFLIEVLSEGYLHAVDKYLLDTRLKSVELLKDLFEN